MLGSAWHPRPASYHLLQQETRMLVSIRLHPRILLLRDGSPYINRGASSADGDGCYADLRLICLHDVAVCSGIFGRGSFSYHEVVRLGVPQQAFSHQAIELTVCERHCQYALLCLLRSGSAVDQCHHASALPAPASRKRHQAPVIQHHHRQPRPIDAFNAFLQLGRHRR